jgi:hypothetical protein
MGWNSGFGTSDVLPQTKGEVMTEKTTGKKEMYYCEVCRCKVAHMEADKTDYMHCGRKMTPMEVAYMNEPSPTGA